MLERLHKVLARAGVAALRPAEDMIIEGRVTVNGRLVRELGARVDPDTDVIAVDGQLIELPKADDPFHYVLIHKPVGVISTAHDTHGRPTVVGLVPGPARLFPVGRLDADSEGLMLLTDDGDIAYRLTHPRFEVEKEYRVLLDRTPTTDDLRRWRSGVELDGDMTLPAWIEVLERTDDGAWVRVVMREGRKRQIREVARLLGYDVRRLIRVREGPLTLGDLPPGQWRELIADEIQVLRAHTQHIPSRAADQERERRMEDRERPRRLRIIRGARRPADNERTDRIGPDMSENAHAAPEAGQRQAGDSAASDRDARPRPTFERPDDRDRRPDTRSPRGNERGFNDRGDRNFNDRDGRGGDDRGERNFNDRGPRDYNDRGGQRDRNQGGGDRSRSFGDRNQGGGDRSRSFGDRNQGGSDRSRSFGDRPRSEGGQRGYDRGPNDRGGGGYDNRSDRSGYGGQRSFDRGPSNRGGQRSFDRGPSDRGGSRYDEGNRGPRSNDDRRPSGPGNDRGAPRRSPDNRGPQRSYSDRYGPPRDRDRAGGSPDSRYEQRGNRSDNQRSPNDRSPNDRYGRDSGQRSSGSRPSFGDRNRGAAPRPNRYGGPRRDDERRGPGQRPNYGRNGPFRSDGPKRDSGSRPFGDNRGPGRSFDRSDRPRTGEGRDRPYGNERRPGDDRQSGPPRSGGTDRNRGGYNRGGGSFRDRPGSAGGNERQSGGSDRGFRGGGSGFNRGPGSPRRPGGPPRSGPRPSSGPRGPRRDDEE